MFANLLAQSRARRQDGVGIDVASDLAGDVGLAGKRERERHEGGLERRIGEDRGERVEQASILAHVLGGADRRYVVDQEPGRQRLHGLPAIEWIAIAGGEKTQVFGRLIGDELDRRGKTAIERRYRRFADIFEHECFGALGQRHYTALDHASVRELERQVVPVAADKADGERHHHRFFAGLTGCCRHGLRNLEPVSLRARHRGCR